MKYWIKFLVCLSLSNVSYANTPVEITKNILHSDQPIQIAARTFHKTDPLSKLSSHIKAYGKITESNYFLNHDSELFDTVTCQIIQAQLTNGSVWEFYYFLDNDKWVGTNIMYVQKLPQKSCLSNLQIIKGIGLGLKFTEGQC